MSPPFLGTQNIGDLHGELLDATMKPCFFNSANCLSISVLCTSFTGYSFEYAGLGSIPSLNSILNSNSS